MDDPEFNRKYRKARFQAILALIAFGVNVVAAASTDSGVQRTALLVIAGLMAAIFVEKMAAFSLAAATRSLVKASREQAKR